MATPSTAGVAGATRQPATAGPGGTPGPATWEQACGEALDVLPQGPYAARPVERYLSDLVRFQGGLTVDWCTVGGVALRGWMVLAGYAAGSSLDSSDRRHFIDVLAAKQHDYGSDNILKHGEQGIKVRVWDKTARIANLIARSKDRSAAATPMNEALEDSFFDIVGYCVIAIMLERHAFTLPLAADLPKVKKTVVRRTSSLDSHHLDLRLSDPLLGRYGFDRDEIIKVVRTARGGVIWTYEKVEVEDLMDRSTSTEGDA